LGIRRRRLVHGSLARPYYTTPGSYREVLTVSSGGSSAVCSRIVTVYGEFRLLSCKATPMGRPRSSSTLPQLLLVRRLRVRVELRGAGPRHGLLTARPLFTYDTPGTYTATLDASTAGRGNKASCEVTVTAP
jgi:hypothetical protein